jgi:hypothetical protein
MHRPDWIIVARNQAVRLKSTPYIVITEDAVFRQGCGVTLSVATYAAERHATLWIRGNTQFSFAPHAIVNKSGSFS